MNNRRHLALALPLVITLVVAGCGDDDKGGSSRPATATAGDAFCVAGEKMSASLDALGAAFDSGDPAVVEAAMGVVLADGAAVSTVAPADIDDQVTSIVASWGSLSKVLEKNGWDISAASTDPDFVSEEEAAALDATGSEIEAYLAAKCGLAS